MNASIHLQNGFRASQATIAGSNLRYGNMGEPEHFQRAFAYEAAEATRFGLFHDPSAQMVSVQQAANRAHTDPESFGSHVGVHCSDRILRHRVPQVAEVNPEIAKGC